MLLLPFALLASAATANPLRRLAKHAPTTAIPTPSAYAPDNNTISSDGTTASTVEPLNPAQGSTITQLSEATYSYTLGSGTQTSVTTIVVTHTNYAVVTYTTYVTLGFDPTSATSDGAMTTSIAAATSPDATTTTISGTSSSLPSMTSSVSTTSPFNGGLTTSLPFAPTSVTLPLPTSNAVGSSTLAASSCTASVTPPAATQTGIVSGCTQWYVAVSGDYCYTVAEQFGIDVDAFMQWNPAVNPPSCSNLLAGDAYCVATCDGTIASTQSTFSTISATASTSFSAPSSTTSLGTHNYVSYTGDGSTAAGWPAMSSWIDFDTLFTLNSGDMAISCSTWGVPNDSDEEIAEIKAAIQQVASESGVDERVILAVVMQESTGCVRVISTSWSVTNPGLMQSHAGNGTCNPNSQSGVLTNVLNPCPSSEILQMIRDGTTGTSSGDGLQQLYAAQTAAGYTDAQAWYRTLRAYNGGSVAASGNLDEGCCTLSYVTDVANRLMGWV